MDDNIVTSEEVSKNGSLTKQIKEIERTIDEGKYKEAKIMAGKLLNDTKGVKGINGRIIVLNKLAKIAKKEKNYKEAKKIKKTIKKKEKFIEKIEISREQHARALKQSEINRKVIKEIGYEKKRTDLYEERIDESQLKQLVEENSSTVAGCIFIAEVCKHLNLEQLGLKCLKGIRRNKTDITIGEEKAISEAEELLKNKNVITLRRDKWDNAYGKLGCEIENSYNEGK